MHNDGTDALSSLLRQQAEAMQQASQQHAALRSSPPFAAQIRFLDRLVADYLRAIKTCWLMATRVPGMVDNSLVMRHIQETAQSVVCVRWQIAEGMLTPARREQRFMLESYVKYLLVDQARPTASLEERCAYLRDHVARATIEPVDELQLWELPGDVVVQFRASTKRIFSELCAYVHPSVSQIKERLNRDQAGEYLGFESVATLREQVERLREVLDLVLVLVFQSLGLSLAGDTFLIVFDDDQQWKFHRTPFMRELSRVFNYKAERKRQI